MQYLLDNLLRNCTRRQFNSLALVNMWEARWLYKTIVHKGIRQAQHNTTQHNTTQHSIT